MEPKLCRRESCGKPAAITLKVPTLGGGAVPYCWEHGKSAAIDFLNLDHSVVMKELAQ